MLRPVEVVGGGDGLFAGVDVGDAVGNDVLANRLISQMVSGLLELPNTISGLPLEGRIVSPDQPGERLSARRATC